MPILRFTVRLGFQGFRVQGLGQFWATGEEVTFSLKFGKAYLGLDRGRSDMRLGEMHMSSGFHFQGEGNTIQAHAEAGEGNTLNPKP